MHKAAKASTQRLKRGHVRPCSCFIYNRWLWSSDSFFFKESNCLKFLWLDKCWHVCYRNKGAYTQTLIQVNNRRSRIHTLYIHLLQYAIIAYSSKKKTNLLSQSHTVISHSYLSLLYHDVWLTCSASNPVCPNNSVIYTYFPVIKLFHDIFNKMHITHLFVGKENKLTKKQIIGNVITGMQKNSTIFIYW